MEDKDVASRQAIGDKATAALGLAQAGRGAIALCFGWALLSVLLFIGFGLLPVGPRADWFPIVVSLLKIGAFLMAAALCWRNTRLAAILSGQRVWQAIAAGLIFYALGDITVILWRSVWGMTSVVSLGDVFYGASYLLLAIGLLSAVMPRQIILSWKQSLGIAIAGTVGIVLACWLNFYALAAEIPTAEAVSVEAKGAVIGAIATTSSTVPAILQLIDQRLSVLSEGLVLLYVTGDCLIIVLAAALLIAFWGGTYSQAWKLIALAGLCLYVADMFLIYQVGQGSYRQGAPWEILWILSALFFGLGASVEHGVSTKMQKTRSRSGSQGESRRQWT
ncbi:MAG: hypothetical protein WBA76_14075 [Phormidesmis sp.]